MKPKLSGLIRQMPEGYEITFNAADDVVILTKTETLNNNDKRLVWNIDIW